MKYLSIVLFILLSTAYAQRYTETVDAGRLLSPGQDQDDTSTRFIAGDVHDTADYTPSDPDERVDWYVDADSNSYKPDGSISAPFVSIASALEAAESAGVPGLNLHVRGGVYSEPLNVTRDTVIEEVRGETVVISGSIVNNTPALLSINGIHLMGADEPGAVYVYNDDAKTILTDVIIESAERHGIFQHGGELWLTNVDVDRTQSVPGVYWCGAGIVVTGGCIAVLDHVTSENNESNGIVVDGAGTYLWGSNIEINDNHINRFYEYDLMDCSYIFFTAGCGALTVQSGAEATLKHISMVNNEMECIVVLRESSASIEDLYVYGTYGFVPPEPWPDGNRSAGNGVRASYDGYVEITDFLITQNNQAGIWVSFGGEMDLHDGEVTHNLTGAAVFTEGFDYHRLEDRVWYRDNVEDLTTDGSPVSGPPSYPEPVPPP